MADTKNIRVRIAPSPTGYPHIGTIYQALFDYSFAKKHNGVFFVRIEDTDRARLVEDAEERIYAALDWFGLTEQESPRKGGPFAPYRQSERLDIYKKYAEELIALGGAYYCFCTKERLEQLHQEQQAAKKPTMYDKFCRNLPVQEAKKRVESGESFVVRLKVPEHTDIVVRDEIRGEIHFKSDLIEDTVLVKADGYPTYHLASSVVDDHLMQTTHLVRGEEWLPSLPKHWIMYDYFGWEKPLFFHTPILRNPDKSKLSKRHGHTSVTWYQEEGFLPKAILNYLALMAWSHPEEKEIFSLDEFITYVDLKDLKPVAPIFDLEKLKWMNGEYIRQLSLEELKKLLNNFFKEDEVVMAVLNSSEIDLIIGLAQTRMKTIKDFKELVVAEEVVLSAEEEKVAKTLIEEFEKISDWNKETILAAMRVALKTHGVKGSMLYKILTGREHGLPLPESLEITGKEVALTRLKK
ncbi:MAG TPA: glutamate--tRNA ligase [Patescibacteria group bacterium]|nr:glutamate--tRNA ligase [Patescibacteria group bacterium]